MTVESTQTKEIYEGNGAAKMFPVPFAYSQTEDIRLVYTDPDGVDSPVSSNFQVNVNESGDTEIVYPVSGQPIPAGSKLTIYRETPQNQLVDLIRGGAFNPDVLEKDVFDRTVMMVQELQEEVDRSIKISVTAADPPKTAEELYAQVDRIADRAEDAVSRAGEAVLRAEAARDEGEEAADIALSNLGGLQNFSIAVDDAPYGQHASGDYNPETGMLTLRVPEGRQGPQGPAGPQGQKGEDGADLPLSNSVTSPDSGVAASSLAVKTAYDAATRRIRQAGRLKVPRGNG